MSLSKHTQVVANKLRVDDRKVEDVSKIMPKVFLGNYKAAKDQEFFDKNNIKAVLNCTKELPNTFSCANSSLEYMRIPIDDSLREVDFNKFYEFLPVITQFIHKHVDLQKNNILIHCHAGRARSCGALVGYLMEFRKMTPQDACELLLKKRNEAFFYGESVNFEKPLMKYYKKILM
jgi:atypical dual specificity phosphatase